MQSIKLAQACTDSVYIIWLKWNTCIYNCSWHWHWLSGFLIRANRVRRKREWGKGCSTQEVPRLVGSGNASSCKRCRVYITINSFDDTMFFTIAPTGAYMKIAWTQSSNQSQWALKVPKNAFSIVPIMATAMHQLQLLATEWVGDTNLLQWTGKAALPNHNKHVTVYSSRPHICVAVGVASQQGKMVGSREQPVLYARKMTSHRLESCRLNILVSFQHLIYIPKRATWIAWLHVWRDGCAQSILSQVCIEDFKRQVVHRKM